MYLYIALFKNKERLYRKNVLIKTTHIEVKTIEGQIFSFTKVLVKKIFDGYYTRFI
jgi:hypothetical protein